MILVPRARVEVRVPNIKPERHSQRLNNTG